MGLREVFDCSSFVTLENLEFEGSTMSHVSLIFHELISRDAHNLLKINEQTWNNMSMISYYYTRSQLVIKYTKILVSKTVPLSVIW